jgi:threonine synthase
VQVRGNFDAALGLVRELPDHAAVTIVNSINPDRIDGQTSAAYEVVDDLGDAPEFVFLPVGNAGNITAYWRGFERYLREGVSTRTPHMVGFQAEGAAPIVLGRVVDDPDTIATAIRIGNPASWKGALAAADESGGHIGSVSDAEILAAWQLLAREESVFCEPASAAGVAGLLRVGVPAGATVVCVLTGNGLKDPATASSLSVVPEVVDANAGALLDAIAAVVAKGSSAR